MYMLAILIVTMSLGGWVLFFIPKPKLLYVLCHTIYAGIIAICLVVQTAYYATDSLYLANIVLVPVLIAGISGFVYRFKSILRNGRAINLSPLLWGMPAFFILNLGLIIAGPFEYLGANNPDMWYYTAVSRNIAESNTDYLRFGDSLLITSESLISADSAIGKYFDIGNQGYIDFKTTIQNKFIGDRYYYYPGETPLITGVTTRNGTEFFVAVFSSIGNISIKAVYNILGGLYPFFLLLSGLWLSQLYKLNFSVQKLLVLFISLSALVHSAVFTQWPGMYFGMPIILYLIGLLKCHLLVPSKKSGLYLGYICIGAIAIYPEALVIAVFPCMELIIRVFVSRRERFYKAVKQITNYLPIVAITLGIPALILMLFRVMKIMGKFTFMPGPEYTETFEAFYKFWVQPAWVSNNVFWDQDGAWIGNLLALDTWSIKYLLFLAGGVWLTTFITMSPGLTSGNSRRVIMPYWLGILIPLIYLYSIGSPYAIDKMFHYSAVPMALILAVGIQYLIREGRKPEIIAWITGLCYIFINLPTLLQLTAYEVQSRFPFNAYTDLGKLSRLTGKDEKILSVIPDMSPQLWVTHFISDLPVVMLSGIFYLENYVSQAYIKEGEKYLSDYHYILIPGKDYPNIEKYDYVSQIVWSNQIFSLVKKAYVFQVYDDKPRKKRGEKNYYAIEGKGKNAFRWINYRIAGIYVNADTESTYRGSYDCEPVGGIPATLKFILNDVELDTRTISSRTKVDINNLVLNKATGNLVIRNITYEPTVFPRDDRPVTFRCFGFSLHPESQNLG